MTTEAGRQAEQYGNALAEVYDLMYPWAEGPIIAEKLASLAPSGSRMLEMGVGSGRVAIPLSRLGHSVHGIEASGQMIRKLEANDPKGAVTITRGDIAADIVEPTSFDVVYIVCNTLFMLPHEQQIEVFRRAWEQLVDGGILVVEVYDPRHFHSLEAPMVQTRHLAADILMIDTITSDPLEQTLIEVHTIMTPGRVNTFVEPSSYRWPRELDLVAQLTRFKIQSRAGDWTDGEFTAASGRHISTYQKDDRSS